jgi:peptide-methionine (S)-S-oxide reductase
VRTPEPEVRLARPGFSVRRPASVPHRGTLFPAELRLPVERLHRLCRVPRHRTGVISTRVGYTGGENDNPTAGNHPGHAEAVEVNFDPGKTSYRNILEFFFQIHRPDLGEDRVGSAYRSEIFYTSDEQRQVAEDTVAAADDSGMWPGAVVTKISQASPFWAAEADDQDYLQRYSDGNN